MKFKFTSTMSKIVDILTPRNRVWVVGGAVRDNLLGEVPKDIDLATDCPLDILEQHLKSHFTIAQDETGKAHGVFRVADHETKGLIDVAILREDVNTDGRHATIRPTSDIYRDLARRDFTINSMATRVDSTGNCEQLLDLFGGQVDLATKTIRFTGSAIKRIKEDSLRMLRCARFATKLGPTAQIELQTLTACISQSSRVTEVSGERVQDEIMKALSYDNAGNMFRWMLALGLLKHIMPDLMLGVGCEQNKYHTDDVFEHLCHCVDQAKGKFSPRLKLAVLFHDIAKPHTKKIIKGQATFHNHEVRGASVAYKWMEKYKFSKADRDYVVKMVRGHQWRFMEDSNEKTIRKWLQKTGKSDWRDLIRLRIADRMGNRSKVGRPGITRHMKDLVRRCRKIINTGQPIFREDLAINGNDLREAGIPPGKIYKDIFANILGIVVSDPEKNTKTWLVSYVKRNYQKNG